jgi:threonine dehydrogenase-like Zn-dependent dehydrogenase
MPRHVELSGPGSIRFVSDIPAALGDDEIRFTGLQSGISSGTELALYRGTTAFVDQRFDPVLRLFVPEDRPWPQRFGYDWVGRVVEAGPLARRTYAGELTGSLFHLPQPHGEEQWVSIKRLEELGIAAALPPAVTADRAVFLSQISIALQAVHDAEVLLGDRTVVFGLGVLGLITVQLLVRSGAKVYAVDPVPERRERALELGAAAAFDPGEEIGRLSREKEGGFDVAIEFSGNSAALHSAVRSLRKGGRVVAAGFYQGGAPSLMLGEEWLHNRIEMRASSRGWGNAHRRHPLWDRPRLRRQAIELALDSALILEPMIESRVPFRELPDYFANIADQNPAPLKGVVIYES